MTERSYQDAVQALQQRMSGRWEGMEADGRDEMARILRDDLGYDSGRANDVIDAMIESGTLRYHTGGPGPAVVPAGPVGTGGSEAIVTPLPIAPSGGYWQIGESVADSTGRKGQVDPT
jgi:hypothetical protein